MERQHRTKIANRFPRHLKNKKLICLDIPDDFEFMDPKLVAILSAKLESFFGA